MSKDPYHQSQLSELTYLTLNKHDKEVTALVVDSEHVYSVGRDGNFIVWEKHELSDSKTTSVKYNLLVCEFGLDSLCYDDDYIYAGGIYIGSQIWIWDKKTI